MSSKSASGKSHKRKGADTTSKSITKRARTEKGTPGSASHTPDVSGTSSQTRQSHQPSVRDEEDEEASHGEDITIIEVDENGKEKTKNNGKSKATVIDEEDEEDELSKILLTAAREGTEYYLQNG
jgi:hypothetical protein